MRIPECEDHDFSAKFGERARFALLIGEAEFTPDGRSGHVDAIEGAVQVRQQLVAATEARQQESERAVPSKNSGFEPCV